jgi:site-specific recombinase XerD
MNTPSARPPGRRTRAGPTGSAALPDLPNLASLAATLQLASPHCLRHTHATHGLNAGVELVALPNNRRQASTVTTSTYLHGEDRQRARQVDAAFGRTGLR